MRRTDPDVIFLAEAFTRPAMMRMLGRIGFHQSYTYFTWRTSASGSWRSTRELAGETAALMRPNFFVNTPDILHAFLQYGGLPAFKIRAVLASMMSPTWGVYSGYELFEHVASRPGSEEYLDSEKYQYRPRDWASYEPGGAREAVAGPCSPSSTRSGALTRAAVAAQSAVPSLLERQHPLLQEPAYERRARPRDRQVIPNPRHAGRHRGPRHALARPGLE